MRLEGTFYTTHCLPGACIPSQTSWSWPWFLLPELCITCLKCFTEKHVERVLVKQWGDGARHMCWVGCNLLSPWCAFLARALCRQGVKVSYAFHSTSEDRYCDTFSGRRYDSGGFGEKQQYGSHYSSLKQKLLFPWYLQKSALEILKVQHLALSTIFPSLGVLSVWMSQEDVPLSYITSQKKCETKGLPIWIALQLTYTCTGSVLQERKPSDPSSLLQTACLRN